MIHRAVRRWNPVEKYRSKDSSPDCVVAAVGDSCYGLHYIKKELGMNPVAFTYDWGMVTDLARRNQSRLCGQLGVEHIMISADIRKKRENIRKNVTAWLRRPELGMIPLFMAGDKQFFKYANMLQKRMDIDLVVFASCRWKPPSSRWGSVTSETRAVSSITSGDCVVRRRSAGIT